MQDSATALTAPVCSAKGCRTPASWALRWNNPRLHEPTRRKTWMACEAHRTGLSDFLAKRGFLRETQPVEQVIDLTAGEPVAATAALAAAVPAAVPVAVAAPVAAGTDVADTSAAV